MSRHRRSRPRPSYGRMSVAAVSVTVTAVAVLGGVGLLEEPSAAHRQVAATTDARSFPDPQVDADRRAPDEVATVEVPRVQGHAAASDRLVAAPEALPADSGSGRRVVFSESAQRVWLVDANDNVKRTYLVSGSAEDNLHPGTYEVYSRSEWAVGIGGSGVMRYFVRFTRGANAAIGFHSIPERLGVPLQTVAQLGTPLSHGCVRQKLADAKALWDFAPNGTTVVVV